LKNGSRSIFGRIIDLLNNIQYIETNNSIIQYDSDMFEHATCSIFSKYCTWPIMFKNIQNIDESRRNIEAVITQHIQNIERRSIYSIY